MSSLYEKSISRHNSFLHKIIEESSKTDGKNILEMINHLSKSIINDIDSLKLFMKKPYFNECSGADKKATTNNYSTTTATNNLKFSIENLNTGAFKLNNSFSNKSNKTDNTNVRLRNLSSNGVTNYTSANISTVKKNPLYKEIEILITEESSGKATSNVVQTTENSFTQSNIIAGTNSNTDHLSNLNSNLNTNLSSGNTVIKMLTLSNFNFNLPSTNSKQCECLKNRNNIFNIEENINFNIIEKNKQAYLKQLNNNDSNYEKLYKEKCEDLERIETKFEEISEKFYFIFERLNLYQNTLIEDNQRLKEIILYILQCYSEKQFDALNYIIQYIKENETCMGKVNFVGVSSIVNYLSNTNKESKFDNFNNASTKENLNSNSKSSTNSNLMSESENQVNSNSSAANKSSNKIKYPINLNQTPNRPALKQLNFNQIKFIKINNTEEEIGSVKKRSISKTNSKSSKEFVGIRKNMSYTDMMRKTISKSINPTLTNLPHASKPKLHSPGGIKYNNINLNNSKIILNNTIIGYHNFSKTPNANEDSDGLINNITSQSHRNNKSDVISTDNEEIIFITKELQDLMMDKMTNFSDK